jgi:hypothetical protein
MGQIQVGFLVSYDYRLIQNALPPIYEDSDTIFLAIDRNRKTWNGETFALNDDFFAWIKEVDVNNKVVIYEDDFYQPSLTTMECEVRERKLLAEKMGIGNWLIQLDSDEYMYDFKKFVRFLKANNHFLTSNEAVQICAWKVNLYKYVDEGVLYVDKLDKFMVATNKPNYRVGRHSKCRSIYTDSIALHDCLSRERGELVQKLENWGHNTDIDKEAFMHKWDTVNKSNYKDIQGFFYLNPMHWKTLEFMPGKNIPELITNFKNASTLKVSALFLAGKNFGQWFRFLFKKQ